MWKNHPNTTLMQTRLLTYRKEIGLCLLEVVCARKAALWIACYKLLVSGWAARCKIVFFMPNLWKWVNRRTGTSRRSSHTFVATDSSGTGPLERTAERPPLQSVVMRKVPLFTPFQVQLATRLGVTTALWSYAFRALDIRPSFVGAVTGIKLNNIYYSHSTMSTHTHSVM